MTRTICDETGSTVPATIFDADRATFERILDGEPGYRVDQLSHGLYKDMLPVSEITTLPFAIRERIESALPEALREVAHLADPDGGTHRFVWELNGAVRVETVLMHYGTRSTVCVSTQAGCAMACRFCATGQAGFSRHLSTGEIVEQVVRAQRFVAADREDRRRVSNVVFMGMGEPLANFDATWGAIRRIHDDLGRSARNLTVSTVGLVPGIRRLAESPLPVNLAISLHAADDALRDELVPVNSRWPIAELFDACRYYLQRTRRRVSLEWALIDGVNDRNDDSRRLADLALSISAHVNLIPLNPTPGFGTAGSPPARVEAFRDSLRLRGVNVTIRENRGLDIAAACGQLAATVPD